MTTGPRTRLGALVGATYCVGTLLVVVTLIDFAVTVWPFAPSEVEWRYGAIGLFAGYTLTPVLGGLLLAVAAAVAGHRAALRAIGVVHLVAAVALAFVLAGFTLDVLQVRRQTAPDVQAVTEIGSARAGLKLLLTLATVAWVGLAGLRQGRGGKASADNGVDLVVGR
jgi:hypothetical protein